MFVFVAMVVIAKQSSEKPEWAKKDVRDYNDADLERLYEQWEEDEEELPEDEKPEHLRKPPKIDLSNIDPKEILKTSKQGKTLMMFVTVSGKPDKATTETITSLWQSSLQNSHIIAERFIIDDDRAIFMFKDGSQAFDAKDFLVQQDRCEMVTIDNQKFPGKNTKHTEL